MRQLADAPQRSAAVQPDALHCVGEVKMRVKLDDAEVRLIVEGAHEREGNRMITAEGQEQATALARRARRRSDRLDGALLAGADYCDIAKIDDAHAGQARLLGRNIPIASGPMVSPE